MDTNSEMDTNSTEPTSMTDSMVGTNVIPEPPPMPCSPTDKSDTLSAIKSPREQGQTNFKCMYCTAKDFLEHHSMISPRTPIPVIDTKHKPDSIYTSAYRGERGLEPTLRRRFPKIYREPTKGCMPLDTTTTDWFKAPDVPYSPPMDVLDVTQKPYIKHNPWKYAYNKISKVYPP